MMAKNKFDRPDKPKDWCLTYEDLKKEAQAGKRKTIRKYEIEWAREYEESLIPQGYRYPEPSDVYIFNQDFQLRFLSHWSGPWTLGDDYTFKKGMKCHITYDNTIIRPERFDLRPFNYQEIFEAYKSSIKSPDPKRCKNISFNISKKEFDEYFELLD